MSRKDQIATLREMMNNYDTASAKWIEKNGTDKGFDTWFTLQTMPDTNSGYYLKPNA